MLQHSKTINKLLGAYVYLSAISIASSEADITTGLTTALATASSAAGPVPVQVADEANGTDGVLTTSLRLPVVDGSTLEPLTDDVTNNEVFGRISEASAAFTLELFTMTDAGVEQAAVVADGTVTAGIPFLFKFVDYPADSAIRFSAYQVGQDAAANGGRIVREKIAATALNTLPALSNTPFDETVVSVNIGGHVEEVAGGAFSVSGSAITWIPAAAMYPIDNAEEVIVGYTS